MSLLPTLRFTFPKKERLVSENDITALFEQGKSKLFFPIICYYRIVSRTATEVPVKVLVSVPKRREKKATRRNYIKRLLREQYRFKKHTLSPGIAPDTCLHIGWVCIHPEGADFNSIGKAMEKAIYFLKQDSLTENPPL